MHLRPAFTETDPHRIRALIRANHFGLLVTQVDGRLDASHIPFLLHEDGDGFTLRGHLAAGNAQCAAIEGGTALAVFSGPHAYVSPGWYEVQPAVPTWDYAAVHFHGTLEPVADDAAVATDLQALVPPGDGFSMADMPTGFRTRMVAGLRAFVLRPARVEAQWKMSQNRNAADRRGVVAGLRAAGMGEVAALVEETLPAGS